MDLIVIAWFI